MVDFDKLFPDEREKGETPIRQCQLVMIRMLRIFDYLCTKHNIEYFLTGGSLLGAIRHKGMIPWDDDIDVGITRENFEKFERLAVPELPNDIFFQTPETDVYFASCGRVEAKLKDKYSSYSNREDQKNRKHHLGLQIDIFVYDRAYLPHNFFLFALNRTMMALYWGRGKGNKGNKKRARLMKLISKFSPVPLVYASSFINKKRMTRIGGSYKTQKELSKIIRTEFEGFDVMIPVGWETYLKRMYGNYMKLPPIEKQRWRHSARPPEPFVPCQHTEILHWHERKAALQKTT